MSNQKLVAKLAATAAALRRVVAAPEKATAMLGLRARTSSPRPQWLVDDEASREDRRCDRPGSVMIHTEQEGPSVDAAQTFGYGSVIGKFRAQARFSPDDPQVLVDLAFGCPYCGGQAGVPRLVSAAWKYEGQAQCTCVDCGETWILDLDLAQILRLTS